MYMYINFGRSLVLFDETEALNGIGFAQTITRNTHNNDL